MSEHNVHQFQGGVRGVGTRLEALRSGRLLPVEVLRGHAAVEHTDHNHKAQQPSSQAKHCEHLFARPPSEYHFGA